MKAFKCIQIKISPRSPLLSQFANHLKVTMDSNYKGESGLILLECQITVIRVKLPINRYFYFHKSGKIAYSCCNLLPVDARIRLIYLIGDNFISLFSIWSRVKFSIY